jgi:5-methyltetrahydropteroyltriglutamate--homocysteine methyltransferase
MQVTVSGRFPIVRHGEHPLRSAVEVWRRGGETTPEAALREPALVVAQAETQRDLIAAQIEAGVDVPSDGYVPIYDEWFALAGGVKGIRVENSIRYLDTNTYYHRWRITGQPMRIGPSPQVTACRAAMGLGVGPVKSCLFGPYTMWAYALRDGKSASETAFDALADIWAEELADLTAAGTWMIQLDESVLLRPKWRGDLALAARALRRIAEAAPDARIVLHLACGDVGEGEQNLLPRLLELPVAGIGLDLTGAYRAPNLAALAGWHGDKIFQAGVADAREIRAEPEALQRDTLAAVTAHVRPERCIASPSTALLYLPRHAAFTKLAALSRVAHNAANN